MSSNKIKKNHAERIRIARTEKMLQGFDEQPDKLAEYFSSFSRPYATAIAQYLSCHPLTRYARAYERYLDILAHSPHERGHKEVLLEFVAGDGSFTQAAQKFVDTCNKCRKYYDKYAFMIDLVDSPEFKEVLDLAAARPRREKLK